MYSVTINTSFLLNENVILLLIKQKLSQSESCINKRNFIQVLSRKFGGERNQSNRSNYIKYSQQQQHNLCSLFPIHQGV